MSQCRLTCRAVSIAALFALIFPSFPRPAQAGHEVVTLPVVLADYYGFAYAQAWRDRSFGFLYPAAGVDLLGWTVMATTRKYSGMFLVNFACVAKTAYPLVILAGKPDREVKRRAWASVGTHTGTLLWLKIWGKPALSVETWALPNDGHGIRLAAAF